MLTMTLLARVIGLEVFICWWASTQNVFFMFVMVLVRFTSRTSEA